MSGRNTRNEHHNILLLPEIDARKVVVIGTTTSNKCKTPNNTRNPISALSNCISGCTHNASHQQPGRRPGPFACVCYAAGSLFHVVNLFLVGKNKLKRIFYLHNPPN